MKVFVVLLSVFALTLGYVIPRINDRIYGGESTTIEEHPYQVSLQTNQSHNCGGSIVNKYTIVTAAHCVHGLHKENITVKVGSTYFNSGEEYEVAKIIEHPEYSVDTNDNDVAVVKLANPLKFSEKVQPIELQPADSPVPEGTTAVATGWGSIIPGFIVFPLQLQMVYLDVVSSERCKSFFKREYKFDITNSMLCAYSPDKGVYFGDSGGPLVAYNKLIGIMSFVTNDSTDNPDVFANVSFFNEFITKCL